MLDLIAHRGMPRLARENTLASFALALDAGADGIELDVHVSRDGAVVVHHDATLPSGERLVDLRARELAPRGIPTLDDVCELVGTRAVLYVEAKGTQTAASIIECLTAHQVRAAVHSFDWSIIRTVKGLAPGTSVGLLVDDGVPDIAAVTRQYAARDIWPAYDLIDASLVSAAHNAGARVIAWTVNEPDDARRLLEVGVDGLCTDDVGALRAALRLAG